MKIVVHWDNFRTREPEHRVIDLPAAPRKGDWVAVSFRGPLLLVNSVTWHGDESATGSHVSVYGRFA